MGERLASRGLGLEIRSLAVLFGAVRCCSVLFGAVRCCLVLFGAAAWRLDLGSNDVSVKDRELLLNELGNRRTRKTRLRNRLTLAKQGPVILSLSPRVLRSMKGQRSSYEYLEGWNSLSGPL